jgi:mono/diheme cytochrome c family protein
MNRTRLAVGFLLIALAALAAALYLPLEPNDQPGGASAETIALGRQLYNEGCAVCHGANLEGQANWQTPLPNGRMPAPPHDTEGHTWHHGDELLFRLTKEGTAAVIGNGYESDMPAFGGILTDAQIEAVLAYIKSTWPERERQYQADMSARERAGGQ